MSTDLATAAPSPIETEVHRIRQLMEKSQFADGLAAATTLVAQVPENKDVLYVQAVCQRYLGKIPEALATLEQLQLHHPGFSRLYQERGHCYVALKDAPHAIEAYLAGVNINPALPASWAKLEILYRMSGQRENASMAAGHVATLKKLPPEVVSATALFSDGDWVPAEAIIRAYLLKHGHHVEAMRLLARIGIARDILDDAEILLEAVLEIEPNYHVARQEYAQVLLDRHKHIEARKQIDRLLKKEPNNRQYLTLYATTCVGLGEHENAVTQYRKLLDGAPRAADLHLSVAHSLKTMGRFNESIDAYRLAAAARPNYGDAYWSLANLKTFRFSDEEIARMRTEESSATTAEIDRMHLCFALGKAYEDLGDYEQSFRFYMRGNELKRASSKYRPEILENNTQRQKETCTRTFFASRQGVGSASAEPIFILGLPRSGSTLLEQILASHSDVEGTHELADIPRIVHDLQGRDADMSNPRYPAVLADLPPEEYLRLAQRYLDDTRVYHGTKPRFIDKMPNNFRHIGLIHLLFPNAKIIDARREPMACCFSNLKQLFAQGQEFTYSIEDIARYYRTYLELMRHWDDVLPGRVLRVLHEDVVEDLSGNVRRILDFCGLEFQPGCVEFHKTERSIRTASSEQVRRPIFREGLDQWKHFAPWLGELEQALGDARTRYRE